VSAGTAPFPLMLAHTLLLLCTGVAESPITRDIWGSTVDVKVGEHTVTKAKVPWGKGPGLEAPVASRRLTSTTMVPEEPLTVGGSVPPVTVNAVPVGPVIETVPPLLSDVATLTGGDVLPSVPEFTVPHVAPEYSVVAHTQLAVVEVPVPGFTTAVALAHCPEDAEEQAPQSMSEQ